MNDQNKINLDNINNINKNFAITLTSKNNSDENSPQNNFDNLLKNDDISSIICEEINLNKPIPIKSDKKVSKQTTDE
jgi:hypothetical protein